MSLLNKSKSAEEPVPWAIIRDSEAELGDFTSYDISTRDPAFR